MPRLLLTVSLFQFFSENQETVWFIIAIIHTGTKITKTVTTTHSNAHDNNSHTKHKQSQHLHAMLHSHIKCKHNDSICMWHTFTFCIYTSWKYFSHPNIISKAVIVLMLCCVYHTSMLIFFLHPYMFKYMKSSNYHIQNCIWWRSSDWKLRVVYRSVCLCRIKASWSLYDDKQKSISDCS